MTDEEVINAAKSRVHDNIINFAHETILGERGIINFE
jgi:hypothetical protein